jgi:hypothetical protein
MAFPTIEHKHGVDEPGYEEALARREARREEELARREAEREERLTIGFKVAERDEFLSTSVGRARVAFDRGDELFQCSIGVGSGRDHRAHGR